MLKNVDIVTEAKEHYMNEYREKITSPPYLWDLIYIIESQEREIERFRNLWKKIKGEVGEETK